MQETADLPSLAVPEQRVKSSDYAGETVLANVWATWCIGCRQEHEFLKRLRKRGAIKIYGINWRDDRDDALRWLNQLGDPYVTSAFDEDGRTAANWGVYGAPESFLISADGIVLRKHLGPLTEKVWQREFVPLIAEQKASR